jgi:hypothetical protein
VDRWVPIPADPCAARWTHQLIQSAGIGEKTILDTQPDAIDPLAFRFDE